MFIDTHCHLSKEDDLDNIISKCIESKVEKIIISGCSISEIEAALYISKQYDNVYLSLGYHPDEADIITEDDILYLKKTLKESKKIVAIGEIGLDFHYTKDNQDAQISLFKKQLDIATKLKLPIVIHSRDATELTYQILKNYKLKGSIHCFSGSYEMAQKYINLGYKLGIGGVLTFKNSKLGEVVSKINLKDIILETDSPYLSPTPYRGEKNYPYYIPIIAQYIANLKCVSIFEVEKQTTNNVFELFDNIL